jgi:E3 ubiquitin-protein ligase HERC2
MMRIPLAGYFLDVEIVGLSSMTYIYIFFGANRKINRVACGSAHTLAWSTNKPVASSRLPLIVPIEYDMLRDIPPTTLRNRLVLLHHFSDLFCPGIAMFPLGSPPAGASNSSSSAPGGGSCQQQAEPTQGMDRLRTLLVSASKEAAFR